MKTLLIPVDFTETTDNAVTFGGEWCKKYEYERIILLHTFYNMMDNIVVGAQYISVNQDYRMEERNLALEKLKELAHILTSIVGASVSIVTALSEEPITRAVMNIIEQEHPATLLLGSDNYKFSSGSDIADHVITLAKISPIRVLIVPVNYAYKPIITALLPYNFNMLNNLDKLKSLQASPQWRNVNLLVLDIDNKGLHLQPDEQFKENELKLQHYFEGFNLTVKYSTDNNTLKGIVDFTKTNDVQLIIALPGKHSFLYSLTHKSISEAIYRNAKEPVLILK